MKVCIENKLPTHCLCSRNIYPSIYLYQSVTVCHSCALISCRLLFVHPSLLPSVTCLCSFLVVRYYESAWVRDRSVICLYSFAGVCHSSVLASLLVVPLGQIDWTRDILAEQTARYTRFLSRFTIVVINYIISENISFKIQFSTI